VRQEIDNDSQLLKTSRLQLKEYLISINGNCSEAVPSQLEVMHNHVIREKSIYTVINQLKKEDTETTYVGFLWSPVEKQAEIQQNLSVF